MHVLYNTVWEIEELKIFLINLFGVVTLTFKNHLKILLLPAVLVISITFRILAKSSEGILMRTVSPK